MHYENKKYNMLENGSSKDNELLLNDSDLSSIKQKIRELETKMSGLPKDNKINKIYQSNYSFSDKTLGNEISRAKTESLEQELLSFVKKSDSKLNKKEKPIYLSHSDYYYCPESKTEKNLNDQIMKYLNENNLIYKKKSNKDKNVSNIFNINYNNFEIKGNKKEPFEEKKILQIIIDNNANSKKNLTENTKLINNNKILYTDILDYNIEKYLEQINKCNNFNAQINQINNIKIKNIYITNNDNINKYGKSRNKIPKDKFYNIKIKNIYITNNENINKYGKIKNKISKDKFFNLKTEKLINPKEKNNINKISFNKNLFRYNSSSKSIISSCKSSSKNTKNKNIIINKLKKDKNKTINKFSKNKINNEKNNMNNKFQNKFKIDSNIVNEKIICNTNKNNINNVSNLSNISLQSIEDSKLMLLADDIISRDKSIDIFNSQNKILNK